MTGGTAITGRCPAPGPAPDPGGGRLGGARQRLAMPRRGGHRPLGAGPGAGQRPVIAVPPVTSQPPADSPARTSRCAGTVQHDVPPLAEGDPVRLRAGFMEGTGRRP